jgi:DNA-binding transcriptional regulator LsrR (DeoR family)
MAASLLEEILTDGCVLGVAWGRTLAATANAISRLPKVSVVQVAGGLMELEFPQNSVDLVYRMAAAGHGTAYPIFLPMWVEDPSLVERLRTEPAVAQVLEWYDRIDVLVVGIGSWNPPVSCLHNSFSKAWRQQVLAAGVRADLCSTLIDDAGQAVSSPLDQVGLALNTKATSANSGDRRNCRWPGESGCDSRRLARKPAHNAGDRRRRRTPTFRGVGEASPLCLFGRRTSRFAQL